VPLPPDGRRPVRLLGQPRRERRQPRLRGRGRSRPERLGRRRLGEVAPFFGDSPWGADLIPSPPMSVPSAEREARAGVLWRYAAATGLVLLANTAGFLFRIDYPGPLTALYAV